MSLKKANGNLAEKFVCKSIPCPSCKKHLIPLPTGFPLYDVQCSGCHFRAQVKHSQSKPAKSVTGGGWDILWKNLKSGHLVPPLFVYHSLKPKPLVRFYPFLTSENVSRSKKPLPRRPDYYMCRFTGLDDLPSWEYQF